MMISRPGPGRTLQLLSVNLESRLIRVIRPSWASKALPGGHYSHWLSAITLTRDSFCTMYDNIQDRAAAGCFAVHCFLLRYNYIQLPVLETHGAAAWHGTTQTAVNNSEGFMIGDHRYCVRHTSGDIRRN